MVFAQTTAVPIGAPCVQSILHNGSVPDGVPNRPFQGLDRGSSYSANAFSGPLEPTAPNQIVNSFPAYTCSGRTVYTVLPHCRRAPGAEFLFLDLQWARFRPPRSMLAHSVGGFFGWKLLAPPIHPRSTPVALSLHRSLVPDWVPITTASHFSPRQKIAGECTS